MKEIKKLLIGLAETFGTTLSEQRLGLYANVLKNCAPEDVERAIGEILTDPAQKFFPLPAMILEHVAPQVKPDHEAVEAANRIVQAIADIGYYRQDDAKLFIGELGWLVVQREGGWQGLCESVTADQLPARKAQWRELAKALIGRAKRGMIDVPPALPLRAVGMVQSLAERCSLGKAREKA